MTFSLDKYDTNTAYADLAKTEELTQARIDAAVAYALEQGRDHVEIHKDGKRLATYLFDGTKLK